MFLRSEQRFVLQLLYGCAYNPARALCIMDETMGKENECQRAYSGM